MTFPTGATPPGPKGPIAWMAGNTVAANLLMAVFLVGGAVHGLLHQTGGVP